MKKLYVDAEIDITLLTAAEALLLDVSDGIPDIDDDDDWFPGAW